MKVLILSITAGQGHNQTAKAICEYLTSINIESEYMDVLEYINPILSESVSQGYLVSTKSLPKLYGGFYRLAEKRDAENRIHSLARLTNTMLSKKLIKYIDDYNPDVIICTHIFAALLVTYVKRKLNVDIKTIGIVTDFTIHPYWEDSSMDYYITASEMLTNQAKKKGIEEERIIPLGIPIHPKFADKINKFEARRCLGIPQKDTILVMSGSMGYGNVIDIIRDLDKSDKDFQILSVCGNNEKLRKKIDNLEFTKNVFNYGFISNVDMFMDAADCIVTKPGGLTTSEALAKGLPIIMVNPIPGQEDRNVEFLLNNGAAIEVTETYPADEAIYQLFTNKGRREMLDKMVLSLGKPNSTKDLADFIINIVNSRDENLSLGVK